MSACAEHVEYQLPNKHSRVGFLLDAIQCADARLQASMASSKTDNDPNGMQSNFEQAAAHLLPYNPVAKKRATGIKHGSALILLTEAESEPTATIAANDAKPSIGKTGVHLHYHKHHDYKKLMRDDRIPSTTPGADPPRDARDSGSARSHSIHLETSSSDRP